MQSRYADLTRFYELLDLLVEKSGGKRTLNDPNALAGLPTRGVYFFFETGEDRSSTGSGLRVVRVGTHALIAGGRQTLRDRLATHRGRLHNGGGNHRGSVFRKISGEAMIRRDHWSGPAADHWGTGGYASAEICQAELPLEQAVSLYIRRMPFLCLSVLDPPGPQSLRGVIERNSIALLSNWQYPQERWLDPPSGTWLGKCHPNEKIRRSGLWNVNHVDKEYQSGFLSLFENLINS